jgi:hypothetical protein
MEYFLRNKTKEEINVRISLTGFEFYGNFSGAARDPFSANKERYYRFSVKLTNWHKYVEF